MNSQYNFDQRYLNCVSDHMDKQNPFGDIPKKTASSVQRSMVAVRSLVKALRAGNEVIHDMKRSRYLTTLVKPTDYVNPCGALNHLRKIPYHLSLLGSSDTL